MITPSPNNHMTDLEQKLADALLTQAIDHVYDVQATHARIESYRTLISAAANNYAWTRSDDKDPCCGNQATSADVKSDCVQTCATNTCGADIIYPTPGADTPAPETPTETTAKRTRRTKEQIAADKAAAEAAAPTPEPTPEPAPGKDVLDDDLAPEPEPEVPAITRGQVQELFTHKLKVIGAGGVAPVNAFKDKVRKLLAKYEAPGGVSTVPEESLAAFHADLVNAA